MAKKNVRKMNYIPFALIANLTTCNNIKDRFRITMSESDMFHTFTGRLVGHIGQTQLYESKNVPVNEVWIASGPVALTKMIGVLL